jgi:hypothetical protein
VLKPYNRITREALRNTELTPHWIYEHKTSRGIRKADEEVPGWKKYRSTAGRELHTGMLMGPQTKRRCNGKSTQGKK